MNTTFRRFKMLTLRKMAGGTLKDYVNDATSILEGFDDALHVCGLVRRKSTLCGKLGLKKPQINILCQVLSDYAIYKLT